MARQELYFFLIFWLSVVRYFFYTRSSLDFLDVPPRFESVHENADSWVDMDEFRKACRTETNCIHTKGLFTRQRRFVLHEINRNQLPNQTQIS